MTDTPRKLLVFGDSLSDAGNFHDLTGAVVKVPIPPASAGYNGWFSNGLVQSLVTADLLDASAEVYAVGGARAVGTRTVADYLAQNGYNTPEIMLAKPDAAALATDTYLGGQIGRYLADAAAHPPAAGTAAAIWIGANDYNALSPTTPPAEIAQTIAAVVGNTIKAAGAIAATGVEHILLYNLPSPEFLPVSLPPAFGQVVDTHNAVLAQGAALLASQDVDVDVIDMHRISTEITADPRTFGFNPAYADQPLVLGIGSQPVWNPAQQNWYLPPNPVLAGVDPDRVMFTDFLHPSSAAHGVLGIFAADSITDNTVFLGDGNDVRATGPLDDLVLAGAGNDTIFSQAGDDTVLGGLGRDILVGGHGRDILAGGAGNDLVHGGNGADVVAGSDGNDVQTGGRGADLLVDGLGFDWLSGDAGNDGFLFTQASFLGGSKAGAGGVFFGGSGCDTLYLLVDDATRAAVEKEICKGAPVQHLGAIDVTTHSIEHFVFLDRDRPVAGQIGGEARVDDADLWGII